MKKNKAVITAVFHSVHLCVRCLDTERKYTVAGRAAVFLTGLFITMYVFYTGLSAWIICYVKKKGNAVYRGAESVPAASVCI